MANAGNEGEGAAREQGVELVAGEAMREDGFVVDVFDESGVGQAFDANEGDGDETHEAGFKGDVEGELSALPAGRGAKAAGGFAEDDDLAVGREVAGFSIFIVAEREDIIAAGE